MSGDSASVWRVVGDGVHLSDDFAERVAAELVVKGADAIAAFWREVDVAADELIAAWSSHGGPVCETDGLRYEARGVVLQGRARYEDALGAAGPVGEDYGEEAMDLQGLLSAEYEALTDAPLEDALNETAADVAAVAVSAVPLDAFDFWALIGDGEGWPDGHSERVSAAVVARGPEVIRSFVRDLDQESERLAAAWVRDGAPDRGSSMWSWHATGVVLQGRQAFVRSLEAHGPPEQVFDDEALALRWSLFVAYDRVSKPPLWFLEDGWSGPHAGETSILAQTGYSLSGLPRSFVWGQSDAFEAVFKSVELRRAMVTHGWRHLEMMPEITVDAQDDEIVLAPNVTEVTIRVRSRNTRVWVDAWWPTDMLRDMDYHGGAVLVADLVQALADKKEGFPAPHQMELLSEVLASDGTTGLTWLDRVRFPEPENRPGPGIYHDGPPQ